MFANKEIQVLFYVENEHVIAQGLEVDICAWGKTHKEAREKFHVLLSAEAIAQNEKGSSLDNIGPAPKTFLNSPDKITFTTHHLL